MTIHPAPYRIKVERSAVDPRDDEQTASGIHVVRNIDPSDRTILRGVIVELGAGLDEEFSGLSAGQVLFYLTAIRLGGHDFVVASWDHIIAWED